MRDDPLTHARVDVRIDDYAFHALSKDFDCIKIGYKCQVLCEFMQGSFVVVLDLLFLVPTCFLLVGFTTA